MAMAGVFTRSIRVPVVINHVLCCSTRSVSSNAPSIHDEQESAKLLSKIPGPEPLFNWKYGNLWRFTPIGDLHNIDIQKLPRVLFDRYGPIVKMVGLGVPALLYIGDAEDVEKIFRTEGQWPERRTSVSLDYYRRVVRKDVFGDILGVSTTQAEEWQRNRSILNPAIMKPQNMKSYHEPFQVISQEFIDRMRKLRDAKSELPEDFDNELKKWSLESISYAALDSRIGCFESNEDCDGQTLIKATNDLFNLVLRLDYMPSALKMIYSTSMKEFIDVHDKITNTCMKYINNKLKEIQERPVDVVEGQSILEALLKNENGRQIAITSALDMMMAGIDTTSNACGFAIYNIATNHDVQEKLYQELKQVLPNKTDQLPKNYLNSIPYLKACIKESHRLTPVALGHVRTIRNDLVLKDYCIPKGTEVFMALMDMGQNEKYFKDPKKFLPERWMKPEDSSLELTHPFAYLPFGFGPRMCVGRRLAEIEMHTLLSMVFRNFKVSYNYGEMKLATSMVTRPGIPLKFKIEERTS